MGIRTGKVQILVTVSLVLAGLVSFKAGGAFSMDHARKRLSVVRAYEREVEKHHDIPRPKLEVCQVMFERSPDDLTAQFCFADGSAHYISENIDALAFMALVTRAGGENVPADAF